MSCNSINYFTGYRNFRFLDRLVSMLEEKKLHEVKLKEGLKDLAIKRMELQNSSTSLWPKQVSSPFLHCSIEWSYPCNTGAPAVSA